MSVQSQLILASMNASTGDILYTFLVTAPRFLLAELNTHRMFSRNTSSSRAIPAKKLRRIVLDNPFVPIHIGANKAGMQAGEELKGWRRSLALGLWKSSRLPAVAAHWSLDKLGVHKQITNRIVEPWLFVQQLISATEVDNFFWLRDHKDAEPHFQELAGQMHKQAEHAQWIFECCGIQPDYIDYVSRGNHQILQPGQWHLPFVDPSDVEVLGLEDAKKVSAARCARTSYLLPENGKKSTLARDLELFAKLAIREEHSNDPRHLSPLEHPAQAVEESMFYGNFKGFKQFRKEIPYEDGPGKRAA